MYKNFVIWRNFSTFVREIIRKTAVYRNDIFLTEINQLSPEKGNVELYKILMLCQ